MEHSVILNFDLQRYMGIWYEIARFDHSFERGLQAVTANYSLSSDGKVRVENCGHVGSLTGRSKTAVGKAKLGAPDDASKPGYLKVSFFLNFYAPYYILALDDDYQYALVACSGSKYLWILSRTPQLSHYTTQLLIEVARQSGFDASKLIFVDQGGVGGADESV